MIPAPMRLLMAAGVALLAGCSSHDEKFAPACPGLALVPDAADFTRYRSNGRDLTDMVIDARIVAVPAACSKPDPTRVTAVLNVNFMLARGPAASGRNVALPYFVGVTRGDQVLDEQDYRLGVAFPANTDRVAASGEQITLNFPVNEKLSASDYRIFVGFRLTPEELSVNRSRPQR